MSQISLPFEWQGQGEEFLVSGANQLAVAHLERWRDWPVSVTILTGPPLSGRSALGRQFVAMSGGSVIDDAEGQDEHMLFHAWNDTTRNGVVSNEPIVGRRQYGVLSCKA